MITFNRLELLKLDEILYKQFDSTFHEYTKLFFSEEPEALEYVIIDYCNFYLSDGKASNVLGDRMLGYGFSMDPFYGFEEMKEISSVKENLTTPSTEIVLLLWAMYFVFAQIETQGDGFIGSLNDAINLVITRPSWFELYADVNETCVSINGKGLALEYFVESVLEYFATTEFED